jgi:hypothetical protein
VLVVMQYCHVIVIIYRVLISNWIYGTLNQLIYIYLHSLHVFTIVSQSAVSLLLGSLLACQRHTARFQM